VNSKAEYSALGLSIAHVARKRN